MKAPQEEAERGLAVRSLWLCRRPPELIRLTNSQAAADCKSALRWIRRSLAGEPSPAAHGRQTALEPEQFIFQAQGELLAFMRFILFLPLKFVEHLVQNLAHGVQFLPQLADFHAVSLRLLGHLPEPGGHLQHLLPHRSGKLSFPPRELGPRLLLQPGNFFVLVFRLLQGLVDPGDAVIDRCGILRRLAGRNLQRDGFAWHNLIQFRPRTRGGSCPQHTAGRRVAKVKSYGRCPLLLFLWLLSILPSFAQGPLLLREAFSREYSIHVGGEQTPLVKEAFSREVSFFIGTSFDAPYPETFSREMSVLVTTPAAPDRVTQLTVVVSPTGDSAILNWSGYNEILQRDVVRYHIYVSSTPFTTISNLTPYATVPAGTFSFTITNLTPWQDHYFAVVAEDALGGYDPVVDYSAAYVLAPEAISRELSLFVGGEPSSPYAQTFSREMSVLITTPSPPDRVSQLTVNSSPTGDSAALNWSAYNELLQRDVVRYDIYISSQPFTTVSNRTPFASVPAGTFSLTASNLTAYQDHYFAVVAVDALGGFDAVVSYSAAYVLAPEAISREFSLFVGGEPASSYAQTISREISILVPDATTPDPVTGLTSGFEAVTSVSAFSALDLNWSAYNELAQRDVVRYRIYTGSSFFTDVSAMQPVDYAPAGTNRYTLRGLHGGDIYYVAVVAEDVLGNWNPTVRSVSAKASIGALGEVRNLLATSSANALHFTWLAPEVVDAFLAHYNVYFGGATNPISLTASATSYDASGLQPATSYPFRIATVDTFNTESAGVSLLAATLLPNPTNVVAQSFDGMVRVTWTHAEPNDLVKTYNVYESTSTFTNVAGMTPVLSSRNPRVDITGLVNGTPYFFAVTTLNTNGSENPTVQTVSATPTPISGNFADLVITNVTGPTSVYSGQNLQISWFVTNKGTGLTSTRDGTPVSSWRDRVVLSRNNVFGDADDLVLLNYPHSGALTVSSAYLQGTSVQASTNLLGNYFLFVLADANDDVYEHLDVGTNLGVAPQQINIRPPMPPIITQQPQSTNVYEGRTVSFSVVAQGSPPLTYQWRHGATALTAGTNATLTLTNVHLTDGGTYSVVVSNVAGATNSLPATLTVNQLPPDLFTLSLASPTNILAGQAVTVAWVVTNAGNSTATSSWQEQLLAADNSAGTNATVLFTRTSTSPLLASNIVTRTQTVIFPAGLSGTYWLAVQVDSASQISEGDGETNNFFVNPQPIWIQSPDLQVRLLTSAATAVFGESFAVNWSVTNSGNGAAFASWSDRVWLSQASNSLAGATLLATVAAVANPLEASGDYTNSTIITLPLNAQSQPGSYWLNVQTDGSGSQPEANENNNLRSIPLTLVFPPLSDLVPAQLATPTSVSSGQNVALTYMVTNAGAAGLTNVIWSETIYLVSDSGLDTTNVQSSSRRMVR